MRKISLKGLRKKADRIFSEYIRRRDKGICCTCGKVKDWKYGGDAGHWIPRTQWGTRYNEINSHFQCFYCNRFAHPQDEYAAFMLNKYGQEVMNELRQEKRWSLIEFAERLFNIKSMNPVFNFMTTREAYEYIIEYYQKKLEKFL